MIESPQDLRRHQRYEVAPNQSISVIIHRSRTNACEIEGRLLDLSHGGAKLYLPESLAFDETVELQLLSEEIGLDITVPSKVGWIRRHLQSGWVLGLAFEPSLPEDCLQTYFERGVLERRQNSRFAAYLATQVRWAGSPQLSAVELVNVGPGGFCLCVRSQEGQGNVQPIGCRLRLILPNLPSEVEARICWRWDAKGGHFYGCNVPSRDHMNLLLKHADLLREERPAGELPRRVHLTYRKSATGFGRRWQSQPWA